jgi:lysyl-tRNA synthetase class 2
MTEYGQAEMSQEWWRPQALARRKAALTARGRVVAAVRAFFAEAGFTEVETPCLQVCPGLEPHLQAFATALTDPYGEADRILYLHTSPEFAMKKLLVAGMERIWQMARVFRNGERSPTHHPEFTMLEWYRAGARLDALIEDSTTLVRQAATAAGIAVLRHGAATCDPFAPWEMLSVADAFHRYADIDVLATAPDPLVPDRERLAVDARRIGISVSATDRWDDIFFKVALDRIEPKLGMGVPTVLHSYPAAMAALARRNPDDSRICDRFELYACGVELANAFDELTDPAEQRRRFEADIALKRALYGASYPVDEDFMAALRAGLPASAGIALGLDRLVMLIAGSDTIDEVLWAPVATR